MKEERYNRRTWLNRKFSPSTGSVVTFFGHRYNKEGYAYEEIYLEISDCNLKTRLRRDRDDTRKDFIKKMKLLKKEITLFINYLEDLED